MKIFFDTNIILDVLTKSEIFFIDSSKAWTLIKNQLFAGYISAISINNIYRIMKSLNDANLAGKYVDFILADFNIIPLDEEILHQARKIGCKDYEDLIQYFSALKHRCSILLTRNKKDFPELGLTLLTPQELIKSIEKLEDE